MMTCIRPKEVWLPFFWSQSLVSRLNTTFREEVVTALAPSHFTSLRCPEVDASPSSPSSFVKFGFIKSSASNEGIKAPKLSIYWWVCRPALTTSCEQWQNEAEDARELLLKTHGEFRLLRWIFVEPSSLQTSGISANMSACAGASCVHHHAVVSQGFIRSASHERRLFAAVILLFKGWHFCPSNFSLLLHIPSHLIR